MTLIKFHAGASEVTNILEIENKQTIQVVLRNKEVESVRIMEYKPNEEQIRYMVHHVRWEVYNNFKTKLGVMM